MGCGLTEQLRLISPADFEQTEDAADGAELEDKPRSQSPIVGDADCHAPFVDLLD